MRALVQRVSHASVTIDGVVHGKIGQGFLVLLGITDGDTEDYEAFIARCRESGLPVETGEFGADMKVELLNDGPVTLWMDTKDMRR